MGEYESIYGGATNRQIAAALACSPQNIDLLAKHALRKIIRYFATGTTRAPKPEGSGRRASA